MVRVLLVVVAQCVLVAQLVLVRVLLLVAQLVLVRVLPVVVLVVVVVAVAAGGFCGLLLPRAPSIFRSPNRRPFCTPEPQSQRHLCTYYYCCCCCWCCWCCCWCYHPFRCWLARRVQVVTFGEVESVQEIAEKLATTPHSGFPVTFTRAAAPSSGSSLEAGTGTGVGAFMGTISRDTLYELIKTEAMFQTEDEATNGPAKQVQVRVRV
jgi:hypothetical protein